MGLGGAIGLIDYLSIATRTPYLSDSSCHGAPETRRCGPLHRAADG